jgi:hypothetical protein
MQRDEQEEEPEPAEIIPQEGTLSGHLHLLKNNPIEPSLTIL